MGIIAISGQNSPAAIGGWPDGDDLENVPRLADTLSMEGFLVI